MSISASRLTLWIPRVLAIAIALYFGVFAQDAFAEGAGFWHSVAAFLLHLTPTFAVLGVVYLAWHRPWLGALVFLSFAAVYSLSSLHHLSWILWIGVPLAVTGVLYLVSWKARPTANRAS
jgi:hypothetical protein